MQENPCRYNSCPCKVAKKPKKKTNLLVFASYHSNSLWQIFMTLPWLINKSGRDNQVWITNDVDGAISNIKNHSSFFCYAYVAVPPRPIIWLNNTDWHLNMTLAPSLSNVRVKLRKNSALTGKKLSGQYWYFSRKLSLSGEIICLRVCR